MTSPPSTILISFVCLLLTGCSRLETEYGDTKGRRGRVSINGMAGFRSLFDNAGGETHDVQRLSERTGRNDAIVWIPKSIGPIEDIATDWFNDWLAEGNHVLVYVLPDSGSEVDYWSQTRPLAPPTQRLEYRRREADAINQRMTWRLRRRSPPSNGWFQVTAEPQTTRVKTLHGPWADNDLFQASSSVDGTGLSIEYSVRRFDRSINDKVTSQTPTYYPAAATGPSTSSQAHWMSSGEVTPDPKSTEMNELLTTEDGDIVVGEVTSNTWPQSKVFVVAGGSLLTNFGLTHPTNRAIAMQLVQMVISTTDEDSPDIAMLVTNGSSVAVREASTGPPTASGMELLSVWPISLITIHLAILGLLSCLVLLPIFGRPSSLRKRSPSNFADHLDAVAALLTRTGDRDFAQSRVDEYSRTVRGDLMHVDGNDDPAIVARSANQPFPVARNSAR